MEIEPKKVLLLIKLMFVEFPSEKKRIECGVDGCNKRGR